MPCDSRNHVLLKSREGCGFRAVRVYGEGGGASKKLFGRSALPSLGMAAAPRLWPSQHVHITVFRADMVARRTSRLAQRGHKVFYRHEHAYASAKGVSVGQTRIARSTPGRRLRGGRFTPDIRPGGGFRSVAGGSPGPEPRC